jgi:diguanylate cyclase (GGDEF)-like protein
MAATASIADIKLVSGDETASGSEIQRLGQLLSDMGSHIDKQMKLMESLAHLDRRALQGLGIESICGAVIKCLRLINPVGWSAVLVPSEFSDKHAQVFSSSKPGTTRSHRIAIDLSEIANDARDSAFRITDSGIMHALQACIVNAACGSCWCLPVFRGTDLKALIFTGTLPDADISAFQKSQLQQVAQRLAIAQSCVEREHELQRKAYVDEVTSLPNRRLINDRIGQEILSSIRDDVGGAVLFLDLDQFKKMNDSSGHLAGDKLLSLAGARIRRQIRRTDTVARIGGDEFVVLMPRIPGEAAPLRLARAILKSMSKPFQIDGSIHYLSCSIGVSCFPQDGRDAETVLKNADIAMYEAKEAGGAGFRFFGGPSSRECNQVPDSSSVRRRQRHLLYLRR